jgi:hypothetical protein
MSRPELSEALRRLLGPAGPELGCDDCFAHLDRHVELRLAGADADAAVPGMGEHLLGCPACREEHDSLLALAGSGAA